MATQLYDFLWDKFAQYYSDKDTNKDVDGKGTFQRFMSIFGLEVTDELITPLENFINQIDPYTADDEYLTLIAWAVGNPQDILNDTDKYRIILSQIISIYQIKGTIKSYQLLFALLGLSVTLTEFYPQDNQYDIGLIYDDDSPNATTYDFSGCGITCTDYSLNYSNLPGTPVGQLTSAQELNLIQMIKDLIQPWTANLRELTYTPPLATIQDTYENVSGWSLKGNLIKAPSTLVSSRNFGTTYSTTTIQTDFLAEATDETFKILTTTDNNAGRGLDLFQVGVGVINTWLPTGTWVGDILLFSRAFADGSIFAFGQNIGIFFYNQTSKPLQFVIFDTNGTTRRMNNSINAGLSVNYALYKFNETSSIRNKVGNGTITVDYYTGSPDPFDGGWKPMLTNISVADGDNEIVGLPKLRSGISVLLTNHGVAPTGQTVTDPSDFVLTNNIGLNVVVRLYDSTTNADIIAPITVSSGGVLKLTRADYLNPDYSVNPHLMLSWTAVGTVPVNGRETIVQIATNDNTFVGVNATDNRPYTQDINSSVTLYLS